MRAFYHDLRICCACASVAHFSLQFRSSIVVHNEYITWLSICIFLSRPAIDRQFKLRKPAILPICLHSIHFIFRLAAFLIRLAFLSHTLEKHPIYEVFICSGGVGRFFFPVCISFGMHCVFHCAWSLMVLSIILNSCQIFLSLSRFGQRTQSAYTKFKLPFMSNGLDERRKINIFQTQFYF